jgi:hypothetical protein
LHQIGWTLKETLTFGGGFAFSVQQEELRPPIGLDVEVDVSQGRLYGDLIGCHAGILPNGGNTSTVTTTPGGGRLVIRAGYLRLPRCGDGANFK